MPELHSNCVCNEYVALRNRVIGCTPPPLHLHNIAEHARALGGILHVKRPIPLSEVGQFFQGKKARKYQAAADSLYLRPCIRKDAFVQAFVKAEKISDPSRDPRMIQFRSARYSAELSTYLKRIEHSLYALRGEDIGLGRHRLIAKGLNQIERCALLRRKLEHYVDPIVRSLDCSRWDQHCGVELLKTEHLVYLSAIPDIRLAEILSWQLNNIGVTSRGIVYRSMGGRMSGDMNTALPTCVLMILILRTIVDLTGWDFDILDDGDDCLFICEKSLNVDSLASLFSHFGHEMKLENVATTLEQIRFCQCNPVFDGVGYKFVRDPFKVLGFGITSVRNVQHAKAQRKLMFTMGLAEMALNVGVPVLQEYASMLKRAAGTTETLTLEDDDGLMCRMKRELRTVGDVKYLQPRPILAEQRVSFALAFGISPWEQVLLETSMREVELLPVAPDRDQPVLYHVTRRIKRLFDLNFE